MFNHCNNILVSHKSTWAGYLLCAGTMNTITNMVVPTFAYCPIASVAGLTGAAVASNHVKAQGILIAVVEPAEALIVL